MQDRVIAAMAIAAAVGEIFQDRRRRARGLGRQPEPRRQAAAVSELDPDGLHDPWRPEECHWAAAARRSSTVGAVNNRSINSVA